MNPRAVLQRHHALRWLAPLGVLGIAALAANGVFSAHASPHQLPKTNPGSLIAAVQRAPVTGVAVRGWSGTVVSSFDLGLPAIVSLPGLASATRTASLLSLLSGSHTMQVWYGGARRQRIALMGQTDETDIFRNDGDVWQWSSHDRHAEHLILPADLATRPADPSPATALASLTPDELGRRALSELNASASVTVRHAGEQVADRDVYNLVLTPRSTTTLIGSVHIDVDGVTKLPLGVTIYARGARTPAIDVAYTSIHFGEPAARNFAFTPPPGSRVATIHARAIHAGRGSATAGIESGAGSATRLRSVRMVGAGWSRLVEGTLSSKAVHALENGSLRRVATPVTGTWGHGSLFESSILDVLVTSDGRVYAGAVGPGSLYAAAGAR